MVEMNKFVSVFFIYVKVNQKWAKLLITKVIYFTYFKKWYFNNPNVRIFEVKLNTFYKYANKK